MIAGFSGHLIAEQFLEQQIGRISPLTRLPGFDVEFRKCRERQQLLGPASSVRTLLESAAVPIAHLLGFRIVADIEFLENAAAATLRSDNVVVALVVTRWGERFDAWWRTAVVEAGHRGASWCLLFNGSHIRLLNAVRVFSRRFVEFDLDCAADDDKTLAALRMLIAADALASNTTRAGLSVDAFVDHSERYASDVCLSLRSGVLEASEHVLRALAARPHAQPVTDVFEQALTIVYRMLFLFFAEGRSLVPSWHPLYRGSYSLERLSEQAIGRTPVGLWDGLRAVSRLAYAGCRAGDLRVTPFNGRLFAPSKTPLAERRDLDDEAARRSLIALSTRPAADGEGRVRIAYRDLGVEQLGAVYETLLDYVPRIERVRLPGTHHSQALVSLHAGSGVRKATGYFLYTAADRDISGSKLFSRLCEMQRQTRFST